MARQKLIHLHGNKRLNDTSLIEFGEIAVRHAAEKELTELAVKTSIKNEEDQETEVMVYFPSLNKVNAIKAVIEGTIETEVKNREDADKALDARLDTIEAFMGNGEGSLNDKLDNLETALQNKIDLKVSTEDFNTKVGELEEADKALQDALAAEVENRSTAIQDAIDDEVEARNTAIQDAIDDEVEARNTAIEEAVAAETEARDAAIKGVQEALADEVTARGEAIQGAIDDEVEARNTAIEEAIATEVENRNTAIEEAVAAETEARDAAVKGVQEALDAHTTATYVFGEGEDKVEDDIHLKAGERERWDAAAEDIEAWMSETGATEALDSLKELQEWINTHGTAADNLVTGVTANTNAIIALDTAYKAADEELDGKITALRTAYEAADEELDGKITALRTTLETDYKAADEALDGKITELSTTVSDIETAYKAADEALEGKITELGTTLREEFAAADTELDTAYKAADKALESAMVTSAEVVMSSDDIINATFNSNKLTFDFTGLIIDCGSYDSEIPDAE